MPREYGKAMAWVLGWVSSGLLTLELGLGIGMWHEKARSMPKEVGVAMKNVQMVLLIDVTKARAVASQVQAAADAEHAPFGVSLLIAVA
jgi:hypothetical protein